MDINQADVSPMMAKYLETKALYRDCILFYRLGDFYEMFFDDAITASRELELTLTGKACGLEERAPMCGIPHHAVDVYLDRLVAKGYKVAICEQTEDPKQAKGLVKREVTRIVTPGTNLNVGNGNDASHNYLMSIVYVDGAFGLSTVDVSTGDFLVTEVNGLSEALDEITRFSPSEIICNSSCIVSGLDLDGLKEKMNIFVSVLDDFVFSEDESEKAITLHFGENSPNLSITGIPIGRLAAGGLLKYLFDTQKNSLLHITRLEQYFVGRYMIIDNSTRRNLELTETMREKNKRGSLFGILDKTKTAMGGRLLKNFIEQPLIKKNEINERLDAVQELNDNAISREELMEYLDAIYDLERLMSKVSYRSANPRDMIALCSSLKMLPFIKGIAKEFSSDFWKKQQDEIDELKDLADLIDSCIAEEPPLQIKEGGIIKTGYNPEVDRLRSAKTDGKSWLMQLETKAKEETGIKNLKIKYNRVFGYYFEVTNSFKDLVPPDWIRKQTLAGAERYTNEELKKIEEDILGAEDKLFSLEYDLFDDLRDRVAGEVTRIQQSARAIAYIDVICSLSKVASDHNYVRPEITDDGVIHIKGGRHPVVEQMLVNDMFIENDTFLDNNEHRISIITGPNMAGKSTYMRQTALIVLMAQLGSFVPAASAKIGICDRIFTRVGASDDLASGQSTFMVEMNEVANILKNATKKSLLILDEIGRGTSTYDGLSIAWAVVEHIADTKKLGAKALFATHYHELTELEGRLKGVNNYCIAVKEQGDSIIFLRKIIKGGADKSYGIQVARLAGLPEEVLKRAAEISDELVKNDIISEDIFDEAVHNEKKPRKKEKNDDLIDGQLSFFEEPPEDKPAPAAEPVFSPKYKNVIDELLSLNVQTMTPLDALNVLYRLKEKCR
ncbi:MAG: DNA mismatch repair protein MutS [Lachnospiraceae bacterium]|nr:DNA mismatch repair protein MutS [Lachnospiraceae bacterium]